MRTWVRGAGVAVGAGAAGVSAGAATAYLQGVLTASWNTIANSGAAWTVMAFAVAFAFGRSRTVAVVVGGLALVGEVGGYYAYDAVRDIPVWSPAATLWTIAALWVGPVAGLAAFYARNGSPGRRCIALVGLCGVLAGEGGYLIRVAGQTRAGWAELVLGCAGAVAALIALPTAPRGRLGAAGAGVLAGVAVYAAYSQPLIL